MGRGQDRGILYGRIAFKRPPLGWETMQPSQAARKDVAEIIAELQAGNPSRALHLLQKHQQLLKAKPRPPLLEELLQALVKPSLIYAYGETMDIERQERAGKRWDDFMIDYPRLLASGADQLAETFATSLPKGEVSDYLSLEDYLPVSYAFSDTDNPKNFPSLAANRVLQLQEQYEFVNMVPLEVELLAQSRVGQEPKVVAELRDLAVEQSVISVEEEHLRGNYQALGWRDQNSEHAVIWDIEPNLVHLRDRGDACACGASPRNADINVGAKSAQRGQWLDALRATNQTRVCKECLAAPWPKPSELEENPDSYPVLNPASRVLLRTQVTETWEKVWGNSPGSLGGHKARATLLEVADDPAALNELSRRAFSEPALTAVTHDITVERDFTAVVAQLIDGQEALTDPDWRKAWEKRLKAWKAPAATQRRWLADRLLADPIWLIKERLTEALP